MRARQVSLIKCSGCGDVIKVGQDKVHIGENGLVYHLSCAPSDLISDAVTEGNAVLARGITYYVNKYLPDELRARAWPRKTKKSLSDEELGVYADLFSRMVRTYRSEREKRKRS